MIYFPLCVCVHGPPFILAEMTLAAFEQELRHPLKTPLILLPLLASFFLLPVKKLQQMAETDSKHIVVVHPFTAASALLFRRATGAMQR